MELRQTQTDNYVGDRLLRHFSNNSVLVNTDLNGFILHPLVGSFRFHLDVLFSDLEGARFESSDQLGGRFEVRFFPRGKYPFRLFVDRRTFDYTVPADANPLTLVRDADQQDQWGGNLRISQGFFKGTQLGFDSSITRYLGEETESDHAENQFVKWDRSSGRVRHRLKVSRRAQTLTFVDLDREHLSAFLDEDGRFGQGWSWLMNTSAIRQRFEVRDVERVINDYQVFGKLFRELARGNRFEVDARVQLTDTDFRSSTARYDLLARYRWQRTAGFQLSPFARYAHQSAGAETIDSPRAGLALSWNARRGELDSAVTLTSSFGTVDERRPSGDVDTSSLDATLSATVGHGALSNLRKQLELTLSRNELDTQLDTRTAALEQADTGEAGRQDLGLTRVIGGQDFLRARLMLDRNRPQRAFSSWLEWSRLEARDALYGGAFVSDTTSATLTFTAGRFSVSGAIGENLIDRESLPDQENAFMVGFVALRPWRSLDLKATYRRDRQRELLTPDLDSDSIDVRATFRFALLEIEGRVFETEQMLSTEATRNNRGFRWSVRRRFSGLLPIFSVPTRRGVVR